MSDDPRNRWRAHALYVASLIIPSVATVQKYAGPKGVLAFAVVGAIVIPFVLHFGLTRLVRRISNRLAWLGVAVCLAGTVVAFLVAYPYAQSHTSGGGSDADDALNIAADELSHGRFPYYVRTYLNNLISPLPGAVFLAMPFRFRGIGNAAYQNLFWLGAYVLLTLRLTRDIRLALLHTVLLLVFCPGFVQQVFTGGDWACNAIYVLVFMHFMVMVDPRRHAFRAGVVAVLFGLSLSSRTNFGMLVPPLSAALGLRFGRAAAIRQVTISLVVATAVTLPFYLYDPAGFAPAHTANKLRQFDQFVPYASKIIVGVTVGSSLALALSGKYREEVGLFRHCAYILAMPVILGFAASVWANYELSFNFLHYGLFFGMFGSLVGIAELSRLKTHSEGVPGDGPSHQALVGEGASPR